MKLNRRTLNVLANILLIVVVGSALIWAFSGRGYDAGYSEALSPWLQVQPQIQWHSTKLSSSEPDWVVGDSIAGWHSWDISEALAQSWYDRAADTTHKVYEKAIQAWALSYLLREQTFVIYFDSTDTMPEKAQGLTYGPPYDRTLLWDIDTLRGVPLVADTAPPGWIR